MKQALVMDFIDSEGKKFSLKLPDPKPDLETSQVQATMELIIAKDVFDRAALVKIDKAYIVTTTEDIIVIGA